MACILKETQIPEIFPSPPLLLLNKFLLKILILCTIFKPTHLNVKCLAYRRCLINAG